MRIEIERVMRAAGELLLRAAENGTAVHVKEGIGNFATDCDVETQRFLQRELKALYPGAAFFGEEDDRLPDRNGACWIVDPIDGTTNFMRGIGYCAVSVGLVEDGVPVAGAVYNPFSGELFSARQGEGAFLNGKPIHVSERPLSRAVASFGATIYRRDVTDRMFRVLRGLFDQCEDVRGFGSAALDMCQVAAGRLDVFWELRLSPWDYAGAACVLREAGGSAASMEGAELPYDAPSSVLAANAAAFEQALAICRDAWA